MVRSIPVGTWQQHHENRPTDSNRIVHSATNEGSIPGNHPAETTGAGEGTADVHVVSADGPGRHDGEDYLDDRLGGWGVVRP